MCWRVLSAPYNPYNLNEDIRAVNCVGAMEQFCQHYIRQWLLSLKKLAHQCIPELLAYSFFLWAKTQTITWAKVSSFALTWNSIKQNTRNSPNHWFLSVLKEIRTFVFEVHSASAGVRVPNGNERHAILSLTRQYTIKKLYWSCYLTLQ